MMKKLTVADIPVRNYSIDDLPNLKASLGKAKVDKVRYHQSEPDASHLPNSKNLKNTIQLFMQDYEPGKPGCWVDDILTGVSRLDHQQSTLRSVPMSISRLVSILQSVELINTRELMKMLDVDKRQAQKYVKACQLIITAVERHLKKTQGSNPAG